MAGKRIETWDVVACRRAGEKGGYDAIRIDDGRGRRDGREGRILEIKGRIHKANV